MIGPAAFAVVGDRIGITHVGVWSQVKDRIAGFDLQIPILDDSGCSLKAEKQVCGNNILRNVDRLEKFLPTEISGLHVKAVIIIFSADMLHRKHEFAALPFLIDLGFAPDFAGKSHALSGEFRRVDGAGYSENMRIDRLVEPDLQRVFAIFTRNETRNLIRFPSPIF
ncbi:hypothetical protein SDC9_138945 [bioreactor metagenome]|uniref:Uncharacterized protein n=1 Tax=bioreactor metagenome TaxID=1076179 RepID=A0A645DR84_9ZZZZ